MPPCYYPNPSWKSLGSGHVEKDTQDADISQLDSICRGWRTDYYDEGSSFMIKSEKVIKMKPSPYQNTKQEAQSKQTQSYRNSADSVEQVCVVLSAAQPAA